MVTQLMALVLLFFKSISYPLFGLIRVLKNFYPSLGVVPYLYKKLDCKKDNTLIYCTFENAN
ncbi:MAG TPA: hypothetical protein DIT34_14245 [Acinetobacter ursingii]|uniref:Uncharacterized protein n=1 Tax=Acinetobacter ursingii TaxID=108980 RepID=A0A3D2SR63_9GAMM|nr:hypothetical protein [Acinetobacter ursingii]HCO09438.1 hypothetical protein [Acinetobacter ursingii]